MSKLNAEIIAYEQGQKAYLMLAEEVSILARRKKDLDSSQIESDSPEEEAYLQVCEELEIKQEKLVELHEEVFEGQELNQLIDSYCILKAETEARLSEYKKIIASYNLLISSSEEALFFMKGKLEKLVQEAGGEVKTQAGHKANYRKSTTLKIENETSEAAKELYSRFPDFVKTTYAFNKNPIKNFLKEGGEIEGVSLQENLSFNIQ